MFITMLSKYIKYYNNKLKFFTKEKYKDFLLWKRSKTKEEKIPELIMEDWKKRGNEPFDIFHPVTYRQKIQWSKLYGVTPLKTMLSDKVQARKWIADKIGEEYLIPIIGIYKHPEEIQFETLPERFVIKMNYSSGMNIIIKDKSLSEKKEIMKLLRKWTRVNRSAFQNFEMQYRDIEPRIIIEQYMEDDNGNLNDYKFLCFNSKVYCCWMDFDRFGDHKRNIYDLEWKLQPWRQHHQNQKGNIPKPKNFEKMVEIAQKLCVGFDHVRVDLYNVNGNIYFGEMTFTNGNGMEKIYPPEYDTVLGNLWQINS